MNTATATTTVYRCIVSYKDEGETKMETPDLSNRIAAERFAREECEWENTVSVEVEAIVEGSTVEVSFFTPND